MAEVRIDNQTDGTSRIELSGDWSDYGQCPAWHDVFVKVSGNRVTFACGSLGQWNTSLVTYLFHLSKAFQAGGVVLDYSSLPEGVQTLLGLAQAVPERKLTSDAKRGRLLERVSKSVISTVRTSLSILDFTGALIVAVLRFVGFQSRTSIGDVLRQTMRCGHQALGIISLVSFLIGVILAFIGLIPLRMFGAEVYIASLIGIGILRLMAPVMVGVVMAGRTGAAFAAELGAMQVNEEVDAYIAMGVSPMEVLVVPRFLALSFAMPLLNVYANLMGILGGLTIAWLYSGILPKAFLQQLYATTKMSNLFIGIFTAWVFGILVSMCGCYHGMKSGRNSSAVGQAATSAVVSSIICMVISTAIITLVTVVLGI